MSNSQDDNKWLEVNVDRLKKKALAYFESMPVHKKCYNDKKFKGIHIVNDGINNETVHYTCENGKVIFAQEFTTKYSTKTPITKEVVTRYKFENGKYKYHVWNTMNWGED